MNIRWLSPSTYETSVGKLHIICGQIEIAGGGGFDGQLLVNLVRDKLGSVAGDERAGWGNVSYLYTRHIMGETDVLMVSAAVVVNNPGKENP